MVKDVSLPVVTAGAVGYRAVGDNMSTRFEYLGGTSLAWWWLAKHSDGTRSYFGEKDKHPYSFAPLVRVSEPSGFDDPAELKYSYATVGRTTAAPSGAQPREFVLTSIEYETHSSEQSYARVEFTWADPAFCGAAAKQPAIGSRLDYRAGYARLSGTRKLTAVKTYTKKTSGAGFDLRSRYDLGYNADTESCTGSVAEERGAPYRELASVQRTVYRPVVAGQDGPAEQVLPPTRFTYGKSVSYAKEAHYGPAVGLTNLRLPESVETNQRAQRVGSVVNNLDPDGWTWTPHTPYTACESSFCPVPVWADAQADGQSPTSYVMPSDGGSWLLATGQSSGESVGVMYVDVNGDRKPDMLKRRGGLPKLAAQTPQTGGCMVDVFLNTASGFFQNTAFPSFSLRSKMGDIPVGSGVPEDGAGELLCSLNRSFSNDDSGGWRGDPNTACVDGPSWGTTAAWGSMQQAKHAFLDWDKDGLADLVTQTVASVDCPYVSTRGIPAPTFHDDVEDEKPGVAVDPHWAPEYLDEALHPQALEERRAITKRQKYFYVYRNTGSGFSATATQVRASSATAPTYEYPSGLEWHYENIARLPQDSVMASYSGSEGWTRNDSVLSDVNGDGFLDLAFPASVNVGPAPQTPGTWPEVDLPRSHNLVTSERRIAKFEDPDPDPQWPGEYTNVMAAGAVDLNGDGLPDRVEAVGQQTGGNGPIDYSGTKVNFNTGLGFGTADDDGEVMFSENADDTNFLDSYRVDRLSEKNWQKYSAVGERWGKSRLRDMDRDGLPDVLFYDRGANRAQLYAGGGRQWVSSHPADPSIVQYFAGRISGKGSEYGGTVNEFDDRADYRYSVTHDAIDINGDGLEDLVQDADGDGSDVTVRYAKPVVGSGDTFAPARLLRTVSNGTGGKTTVSYTRDVAAGKWLATTVTADPGHGQPAIISEHSYIRPVFVADLYGRKAFSGYEETHTIRNASTPGVADNVTHVTMYSYQVQPGGVPILSATVMGHHVDAAGIGNTQPGVMSIVEPSYHVRNLPGGLEIPGARADYPMRTVLPSMTISRTCTGTGGQMFDACHDSPPSVTSETTWVAKSVGGEYVMELPSVSETRFVNGEGKDEVRRSTSTFNVYWNGGGFRVAADKTVDAAVVDGTYKALGEVRYTYDTVDFSRVQTVTVDDAAAGVPDKTSR
ncbi:VCBS repeat-containing protein, partial [Catellatospora sp. NPDC049609]|uniref:FG-GAP repeat domain-containing protein n=1 Tax=Catellatospora sp. NPDC049609 TaxID=3155505 RepID=UPI003417AF81